jgi:hypothetical protein
VLFASALAAPIGKGLTDIAVNGCLVDAGHLFDPPTAKRTSELLQSSSGGPMKAKSAIALANSLAASLVICSIMASKIRLMIPLPCFPFRDHQRHVG